MRAKLLSLCLLATLCGPLAADEHPLDELWWPVPDWQAEAAASRGLPLAIRTASGQDMVLVPPGHFLISSPESEPGRRSNEGTMHLVELTRPFYVAATEVTQRFWDEVMERNPSNLREAGEDAPVESISWYDAALFCNKLSQREGLQPVYRIEGMEMECHSCQHLIPADAKTCNLCGCILRTSRRPIYSTIQLAKVTFLGFERTGYRLPTEAEWEFTCRAGSITAYGTGDSIEPGDANFKGSLQNPDDPQVEWGTTVAVGSYAPNAWGLYDMHGNVAEWCWDRYGPYPEERRRTDPLGPERGDERVRRGGTWGTPPSHCRSARREHAPPGLAVPTIGLRLVRSVVSR